MDKGNKKLTSDGHECTMAINVLSPYLLTTLLMSLLRKSKSTRVITVASSAYKMVSKPDFDNIDSQKNHSFPQTIADEHTATDSQCSPWRFCFLAI